MSQEHRQLAMYHDPFSRATKQPKIPDGKANESLGFQTQAVLEAVASSSDLHFLLYPGQDAGLVIAGDLQSDGAFATQKYNVVGFTGSNGMNWNSVSTAGGIAAMQDNYAWWRCVSSGLRLSLLNPAEEDDGWWEAVRVTEPMETTDYQLTTKDTSANRTSQGTIAPTRLLNKMINRNLVNERSYTTGLLRDLKKHVFSLHGVKDEHDLRQQSEYHDFQADDITNFDSVDVVGTFDIGKGDIKDIINTVIDPGYDMIYIRVKGRSGTNKSRLHVNVVSNQEITFGADERESRFHTASANIGPAMSEHIHAKRSFGSASHVVPGM
jgi:hypothetical protein